MPVELRKSGIEVLGDISWGMHFCQFYQTKEDLLDILVPFFKAGLENNEYCLWIICDPVGVEEAYDALDRAIPGFWQYRQKKQIEIFPCRNWHVETGAYDGDKVGRGWLKKLEEALANGYDGIRINGNEGLLDKDNWHRFMNYEQELNALLVDRPMIVLCTYPLSKSPGSAVLDVAHLHECVVAKRKGKWEILEQPEIRKAKFQLQRQTSELERKVDERTRELAEVIGRLKNEIARHEQAAELLVREKELSNEILDSIPALVVIVDENFRYLRWNSNLELTTGFRGKELLGLHAVEDFYQDEASRRYAYSILGDAFKNGMADGDLKPVFWGQDKSFHITARRIIYEGKVCLICLVADITGRKKAEEELDMAYRRLSFHVQNTPLAVIEWDKDFFFSRWSEQAEKIFGWEASEMLGRSVNDQDIPFIYVGDQARVGKIIHELTHNLADRSSTVNRNYTKDGRVIYCEWYVSVLRDEQGEVITILALAHDVTERKEAEEKLNESYREIRSLSEHLHNIREEERARIAREIHDELGQQLTVMKMDISWLNKKTANTSEAKEKFNDLLQILDNTMNSVRRISHELRPHLLDLGLGAAIEWHLEEFEKRTAIKAVFNDHASEGLNLDEGVKTGLFRILQESITNVTRHSEAGKVRVDLQQENESLRLRITDEGKGFDKRVLKEKRTLGILGMKERAEMMGGHFDVESSPGKGTTVTVIVPLNKNSLL
jgi:PAS domain S-box-containing protein